MEGIAIFTVVLYSYICTVHYSLYTIHYSMAVYCIVQLISLQILCPVQGGQSPYWDVGNVVQLLPLSDLFLDFLDQYQAFWLPLSFHLAGRYLAILDQGLFDHLSLAMMMDRKMKISAESSEKIWFIVNQHSVSALFSWTSERKAKFRNVWHLDSE